MADDFSWPVRSYSPQLRAQVGVELAVEIDDGLITGPYAMRNPEKLSHMQRETALRR